MKLPFVTSLVALSVVLTAAAADERAKIANTIDEFCSWTGMKRVSELRDIGHWKTLRDTGGNARFDLLVDGKRIQYRLILLAARSGQDLFDRARELRLARPRCWL